MIGPIITGVCFLCIGAGVGYAITLMPFSIFEFCLDLDDEYDFTEEENNDVALDIVYYGTSY